MCDHVKHVAGWTIMAYHVYDSPYCKVMAIVVYNTQFEDMEAQQVMWIKFNDMMLKHKFLKLNFKGFMADNTYNQLECCQNCLWIGGHFCEDDCVHVYSTRLSRLINKLSNCSNLNYNINTSFFATSTRVQHILGRLTISMF